MTRILTALIAAELVMLATYLQAPELEANPAIRGRPDAHVIALVLGATVLAAGLAFRSRRWRKGARVLLETVLLAGAVWVAFSAGTNVGTLASVAR